MADVAQFLVFIPELGLVAVGCLICWAVHLLLASVRYAGPWKQAMTASVASLASAALFSGAQMIIQYAFGVAGLSPSPTVFVVGMVRFAAPFGLWAGVVLLVTYHGKLRARQRHLAALRAQTQDAQMRALRYQVNPHLLYNMLNSIARLILDRQKDRAEAMVLKLADFFRATLSSDPHAVVPLAEEIALQRLYLGIERLRFPHLSVEIDVPDELGSVHVPSLILQPLVENVIKHGINPHSWTKA